MTIGMRAAEAIKERARKNGSTLTSEFENLGLCRKVFGDWQKRGIDPSAYYLQQMALAGYDVIYILTGKENNNVTD